MLKGVTKHTTYRGNGKRSSKKTLIKITIELYYEKWIYKLGDFKLEYSDHRTQN